MSDVKTVIGDKMLEAKLNKYSDKLNISVDELIEQYIRRGIYRDNFYESIELSKEKILELFNLDKEPSEKKESSMDSLIGIYVYPDE